MFENMEIAMDIVANLPIADDARERIDALYEASSEEERAMFSKVYEGLFLLENK